MASTQAVRNKSRSGVTQGMTDPYRRSHKFEAIPANINTGSENFSTNSLSNSIPKASNLEESSDISNKNDMHFQLSNVVNSSSK